MENARLEFLYYLSSLKVIDPLKVLVGENGKTNGYKMRYRPCGYREISDNGLVYCLAAETLGFVGTGIIEKKCEFCKPSDELELRCTQGNYLQ